MDDARRVLPVLGPEGDEGAAACGPKASVTLEEASILAAMRALRERAEAVRERLLRESEPERRVRLEADLETLRAERAELVRQREVAYRNKMVMLGHLPANEE